MADEVETIIESAVKYKGVVYTGKRHHNAIKNAADATKERPINGEQGFYTSFGRFVTREEGAQIALAAKQIEKLRFSQTQLFSEDIF